MVAPFASVAANVFDASPALYAALVVVAMAVAAGAMYGVVELLLKLLRGPLGATWRRLE
ncbi:MAG: hypothetical protein HY677_01230 [Chloroflexi bacterium]|nr:hypothetical protein [Chloroflexota bacterium]